MLLRQDWALFDLLRGQVAQISRVKKVEIGVTYSAVTLRLSLTSHFAFAIT
jgi:hypothetical protein